MISVISALHNNVIADDVELIEQGTPYLQARFAGIVAIGMNFCFRGFWSAIHKTGFYLRTLLVMHALNILLNYVLILLDLLMLILNLGVYMIDIKIMIVQE